MNSEKKMDLVDAIGWALDGAEKPVDISSLKDLILIYLEDENEVEFSEKMIRDCVERNSDIFDYHLGVISFKGHNYHYYDLIAEISELIYKSHSMESQNLVITLLLIVRFYELQQERGNIEVIDKRLMHRVFSEPERLSIELLNEAIYKLLDTYSIKGNYGFNTGEENQRVLKEAGELIGEYDWRPNKINHEVFEKIILTLSKSGFRSKYPGLNEKLSDFLKCILEDKIPENGFSLRANRVESIPPLNPLERVDSNLTLILDGDNSLTSILKALVKGYKRVNISTDFSGYLDKREHELTLLFPPIGRITKKELKEMFPGENLRISSMEEMTVKLALGSMSDDGVMHLIIPDSFLFSSNSSLSTFRKKLIKKQWINSAIKLPRSFKLEGASINFSLITIDKSGSDKIYYCDLSKYGSVQEEVTAKLAFNFINEKKIESEVSRYVTEEEISDKDFDLSIGRYVNPIFFKERYTRYDNEEVFLLKDLIKPVSANRVEVSNKYPFVNMTQLADEAINFILDTDKLPKKEEYSSNQPLLDSDALLIGTIGGVLKPTLFYYQGTPIFIGPNVVYLKVNLEKVDSEYLIQELNSEFVKNQISAKYRGSTISHIRKSDILNIAIRVPEKDTQIQLFKQWTKDVANQRMKALNIKKEQLFQEEYDLIHDLHHTLKNELPILKGAFNDLVKYIRLKDETGERVDLKEYVRPVREGVDLRLVDSVEQRIQSTNKSLAQLSEFVNNYKTVLKFDKKNQNRKPIIIKDFLEKLCSKYKTFEFDIREDIDKDTKSYKESEVDHFEIMADEAVLRLVVMNVLDNAVKYGFEGFEGLKFIDISIRDTKDEYVNFDSEQFGITSAFTPWVEISIRNIGNRVPENFNKDDFFKKGYTTAASKSGGLGGYHIQKAMKSMDGEAEVNIPEESPFSFEVKLKFSISSVAKSPNWGGGNSNW